MYTFGQRLKSARIMAKLSMDNLVEKVDRAVSKQTISKYERGVMAPKDSEIVIKLARALNVPVDYFFKQSLLTFQSINFRKKTNIGIREERAIKEHVKALLERYYELEELLHISPDFINPLDGVVVLSPEDVEKAAQMVREKWGLGDIAPITRVIDVLEENEVKVVELELPEGFDGISGRVKNNPFIVIKRKSPDDRKRFTALHELAHLIIDFPRDMHEPDSERICHSFAGAMLLPEKALKKELRASRRSNISLYELLQIKEQYGISIQAIMARARALHIISEHSFKLFYVFMNRRNMKINEPGKYPLKEESVRFKQLLHHALAEEIISISKASALSESSLAQLEREMVELISW